MKKKILLASIIALSLALLVAVGGTIAYLFTETGSVVNNFTYGDINIQIHEFGREGEQSVDNLKMVPGNNIPKDPSVTVLANSEECYLFVQITESENFDDFMTYAIKDGWILYNTSTSGEAIDTAATNSPYVIYRIVENSTESQKFPVLANDIVHVKENVLKTELNALTTNNNYPSISFYAYAVQKANVANVETAYAIAQQHGGLPTTTPNP